MNITRTIVVVLALSASLCHAQYTDVINSNRPGRSRSAFSVGKDVAQVEFGGYTVKEKRQVSVQHETSGFGIDFSGRYGVLFESLEINLEGRYQNDTKRYLSRIPLDRQQANLKTLTLGANYLIYDPHKNHDNKPNLYSWKANHRLNWKDLIPAVSVYVGMHYDTKDNPYTAEGISGFSPKLTLVTQHNFSDRWVFVMNFSKDRVGTDQADFEYILTLTHAVTPKWAAFIETQGIDSHFYADNLFRFGGGYLWHKNFQLDTSVTFNTKDTPRVFNINFGASYRFDFHKDKMPPRDTLEDTMP